jgi:hypothetical protein
MVVASKSPRKRRKSFIVILIFGRAIMMERDGKGKNEAGWGEWPQFMLFLFQ